MQDIPKYTQNTFILYSAATGTTSQELQAGITPLHIRQTCSVTSESPMTVSGGLDDNGLTITPVLSEDRLTCSFDIKITSCNFTTHGDFSVTFKTEGDADLELEGAEHVIQFFYFCYGFDRPYLPKNFVEYNCTIDPLLSRQSLVPISVNGLSDLHIAQADCRNGTVVVDTDIASENTIYYNWAPGDTGYSYIGVEGVTYEGDHGVGGKANPFPQGIGADPIVIANYPDYYASGYTCALVPAGDVTLPEYAIYGGVMGQYGGVFEAVPDDNGNPQYWLHKYEEKPSDNTAYHIDHQIYSSGGVWVLQSRSYLDDTVSEWQTIATAPMATLTIPAIDDGKKVTLEGVYSLPPFSGWSDSSLTVSGDGKYFTQEKRFLNTVNVSSPDDDFTEFAVYAGQGGVMYQTEKQTYEVTDNDETRTAELILFPDAQGWQISSGSSVVSDVQPKETTQAAVTYAPPRRDDTAFTPAAKMAQEISGATVEIPVPMALNNDLGGMMITAGDTVGGTWKRYPYQRLNQQVPDAFLRVKKQIKSAFITSSALINYLDGDVVRKPDINELNIERHFDRSRVKPIVEWREDNRSAAAPCISAQIGISGTILNGDDIASVCAFGEPDKPENPQEVYARTYYNAAITDNGRIYIRSAWEAPEYPMPSSYYNYCVVSVTQETRDPSPAIYSSYLTSSVTDRLPSNPESFVDLYVHFGQTDSSAQIRQDPEHPKDLNFGRFVTAAASLVCDCPTYAGVWSSATISTEHGTETVSDVESGTFEAERIRFAAVPSELKTILPNGLGAVTFKTEGNKQCTSSFSYYIRDDYHVGGYTYDVKQDYRVDEWGASLFDRIGSSLTFERHYVNHRGGMASVNIGSGGLMTISCRVEDEVIGETYHENKLIATFDSTTRKVQRPGELTINGGSSILVTEQPDHRFIVSEGFRSSVKLKWDDDGNYVTSEVIPAKESCVSEYSGNAYVFYFEEWRKKLPERENVILDMHDIPDGATWVGGSAVVGTPDDQYVFVTDAEYGFTETKYDPTIEYRLTFDKLEDLKPDDDPFYQ